jgi:hypothetical protein
MSCFGGVTTGQPLGPLAAPGCGFAAKAASCPALAFLTKPAGSCQTYGLAKGLARTAAAAADSPCIAI